MCEYLLKEIRIIITCLSKIITSFNINISHHYQLQYKYFPIVTLNINEKGEGSIKKKWLFSCCDLKVMGPKRKHEPLFSTGWAGGDEKQTLHLFIYLQVEWQLTGVSLPCAP